jgi:hypothetical protein
MRSRLVALAAKGAPARLRASRTREESTTSKQSPSPRSHSVVASKAGMGFFGS